MLYRSPHSADPLVWLNAPLHPGLEARPTPFHSCAWLWVCPGEMTGSWQGVNTVPGHMGHVRCITEFCKNEPYMWSLPSPASSLAVSSYGSDGWLLVPEHMTLLLLSTVKGKAEALSDTQCYTDSYWAKHMVYHGLSTPRPILPCLTVPLPSNTPQGLRACGSSSH